MKVLVTGGAGYIGSETVRYLRKEGLEPVVLDNLSTGSANAVDGAQLYVGDILDSTLLRRIFSKHQIDSVIHFAACKNVGESMRNPEKYWLNNVLGTKALLQEMDLAGVRKIVFSSSCSVYGNPGVLPVVESTPINPQSVYAESKYICERLLQWAALSTGTRSIALRYFNAAGASLDGFHGEDWNRSENLIPRALRALLLGDVSLEVFGSDYATPDGTAIRDYVHVNDLAVAHFRALQALDSLDGFTPINLGTGKGSSVREILSTVERISGRSPEFSLVARRRGDPESIFADFSLAKTVLDWQPMIDLVGIISTALKWHERQTREVAR